MNHMYMHAELIEEIKVIKLVLPLGQIVIVIACAYFTVKNEHPWLYTNKIFFVYGGGFSNTS